MVPIGCPLKGQYVGTLVPLVASSRSVQAADDGRLEGVGRRRVGGGIAQVGGLSAHIPRVCDRCLSDYPWVTGSRQTSPGARRRSPRCRDQYGGMTFTVEVTFSSRSRLPDLRKPCLSCPPGSTPTSCSTSPPRRWPSADAPTAPATSAPPARRAGRRVAPADPARLSRASRKVEPGLVSARGPARPITGPGSTHHRARVDWCWDQLVVRDVSSTRKLVAAEESSTPSSFTVTVLPV